LFPRRAFSFVLRIFSTVSYFEAGCMSRRDYFGCQIYNFDILPSPILPLFAWENIDFYIYFGQVFLTIIRGYLCVLAHSPFLSP